MIEHLFPTILFLFVLFIIITEEMVIIEGKKNRKRNWLV